MPHSSKKLLPSYSEPQRDARNLVERFTAIDIALSAESDLDQLLQIILTEAKKIARADKAVVYYRTTDDKLVVLKSGGKGNNQVITLATPSRQQSAKTAQAFFANLLHARTAFGRSVLTVPIITHERELLGCIRLENSKGHHAAFSMRVRHLVQSLAAQAAIILADKRLIQAQADCFESFACAVAKAIDAKSLHTTAHSERVALIAVMLAEAACSAKKGAFKDFQLSDKEKYELRLTGLLHDIGKLATPERILNKSTKLETVFDRIELMRLRFEMLKRDAKIAMLKKLQRNGADSRAIKSEYRQHLRALNSELALIRMVNEGVEWLTDERIVAVNAIARKRTLIDGGRRKSVLSEEELHHLNTRKGNLTQEERAIIEEHAEVTYRMLEGLPFPKHLQNVPQYAGGHHERMDGRGYPRRIKMGTLPVPARILAVADTFEALTAKRSYKKGKLLSETMLMLSQMKEQQHLDPDLVDLLISSGVYRDYAQKHLAHGQIDAVDEKTLLAMRPKSMVSASH